MIRRPDTQPRYVVPRLMRITGELLELLSRSMQHEHAAQFERAKAGINSAVAGLDSAIHELKPE